MADVQKLLASMTIEEKLAQISCVYPTDMMDENMDFVPEKAKELMPDGVGDISGVAYDVDVPPEKAARLANEMQAWIKNNTRLGIPAIIHEEALAGLTAKGAPANPHPIGLGSMWQPELVGKMASRASRHVRAVGASMVLTPVLDTLYDPRWGRCEETYSEDAYLASENACAFIRAMQGDDLKKGVAATAKHFAGHAFVEGGRNKAAIHMGEREMRTFVLYDFERAVKEANVRSIMTTYHAVDGVPMAANKKLMTGLLRDEWGFDGIVFADYNSIDGLATSHRVAADYGEAGAMALEAGIDLEAPKRICYAKPLLDLIKAGKVPESLVDRAAGRMLKLKNELGLLDGVADADPDAAKEMFADPENSEFALTLARKSMVLLKNDGTLPLDAGKIRRLALIGPQGDSRRAFLGDYSYAVINNGFNQSGDQEALAESVTARPIATLLEELRKKLPGVEVTYTKGCGIFDGDCANIDEAVQAAKNADAVILAVGDRSGMFFNGTTGENLDRADVTLTGEQECLVREVTKAVKDKPVALVLIGGKPLALGDLWESVNAALEAWIPGERGAQAITETLFGDNNPAGRLPVTMLRTMGQHPLNINTYPGSVKDYVDIPMTPAFPFGHGLSYTRFDYQNLSIEGDPACDAKVRFEIENTGERDGEEVAQVYINDPVSSVERPSLILAAFKRISLKKGERRRVELSIRPDRFALWDGNMRRVVEKGGYIIKVGASSGDIRLEGGISAGSTVAI